MEKYNELLEQDLVSVLNMYAQMIYKPVYSFAKAYYENKEIVELGD